MQADNLHGSGFSFEEPERSIKVIIVYDDPETAKRAEAIYKRLACSLRESGFDFEHRLWRFDVLEDEGFCAAAARDTADADIVVVAADDHTDLPKGVQNWLEISLEHRTGTTALVALLQHASAPITPYLREIARRGGMDFFAQTEDKPRLPNPAHVQKLSERLGPADMTDPPWLADN